PGVTANRVRTRPAPPEEAPGWSARLIPEGPSPNQDGLGVSPATGGEAPAAVHGDDLVSQAGQQFVEVLARVPLVPRQADMEAAGHERLLRGRCGRGTTFLGPGHARSLYGHGSGRPRPARPAGGRYDGRLLSATCRQSPAGREDVPGSTREPWA